MSEPTSRLPARPSLEHLRKLAKERLAELRVADPSARLADAQFALAREHGFGRWPKWPTMSGSRLHRLTVEHRVIWFRTQRLAQR